MTLKGRKYDEENTPCLSLLLIQGRQAAFSRTTGSINKNVRIQPYRTLKINNRWQPVRKKVNLIFKYSKSKQFPIGYKKRKNFKNKFQANLKIKPKLKMPKKIKKKGTKKYSLSCTDM